MKPRFKFFFDWTSRGELDSMLWAAHAEAHDFKLSKLTISDSLQSRANVLADWYITALDWSDPSAPCPWRQEECDRFRVEIRRFFLDLRAELAEHIEIIYKQYEPNESPCLDEYLRDPNNFTRRNDPDCDGKPTPRWNPDE
jgi:hypothetical protein